MSEKQRLRQDFLRYANGESKVLLHSCCAPCSGAIIEIILTANIELAIFFYNPNIHPRREYDIRKTEIARFAEKLGVPIIDGDYDCDVWFVRTKGLEREPERGQRCTVCFDMRLEAAAHYAFEHGFSVFTSSLGISRWKDLQQVSNSGRRAAACYPNLVYWDCNWRKDGGVTRMAGIARREGFYRQKYCGCVYSLRQAEP